MMPERQHLTDEELRDLCLQWQKRLRLQDWDVAVLTCREREFVTGTGSVAEVSFQLVKKRAVIRLLEVSDGRE